MTRVLVTGGRDYGDLASLKGNRDHPDWARRKREYQHVLDTLTRLSMDWPNTPPDQYGNNLPAVTIISGGARGVGSVAIDWVVMNWCQLVEFPADWAAGPIRNQRMLNEGKPDLVVAFPGGRGTEDMKKLARRAGIEVLEVE